VGGVDGRILAQINATTYQWNADAGLTFENRPLLLSQDRIRFGQQLDAYTVVKLAELEAQYLAIEATFPTVRFAVLTPAWNNAYIVNLQTEYNKAEAIISPDPEVRVFPKIPSFRDFSAAAPVPNPDTYNIADPTLNEVIGRNGLEIANGEAVVLMVDRVRTDPVTGDTLSIHVRPTTLKEEILNALATDPLFKTDLIAALVP